MVDFCIKKTSLVTAMSSSDRPKNICLISSSFPMNKADARAAAGLFVRDFVLALNELGHRVTVVTPDKFPGEKEGIPGVDVNWFPWLGGGKPLSTMKPWYPLDAAAMLSLFVNGMKCLTDLAAVKKFDHTLAMWAVPAGIMARCLKKTHNIPYSTWCLGSDIWTYARYPILKSIVRKVLLDSDLIFADGIKLAMEVTRICGRPCPFLPSSRRLDRTLAYRIDSGDVFKFLFVGRYAKVKGVDILLEAMSRYITEGGDGQLFMFGGGPLTEYVTKRAAEQDLRGRVTVGGFASEEDVVSYLKLCDCLMIPSRMESIPVVMSDALQMNKPLIVSDVGDMGLLVREHRAGMVVPCGSVEDLSKAMELMAGVGGRNFQDGVAELMKKFDIVNSARIWSESVFSS